MKIIGTFGLVVTASVALLQPAQGGSRGSGRSFSPGGHFSAPSHHYSGASRNYSSGAARSYAPSSRFSSGANFRNRSYTSSPARFSDNRATTLNSRSYYGSGARFSADRTAAFNSRVSSNARSRFSAARSAARESQAFNNNSARIVARRSGNWNRNWDRRQDHFWRGHRCRWVNNSWLIFATGFYPYGYGYGYYPYGGYSYYDDGYYDSSYAANEYAPAQSDYDNGDVNSNVSEVQSALSREGYYSGAIDGSFRAGHSERPENVSTGPRTECHGPDRSAGHRRAGSPLKRLALIRVQKAGA